MLKCIIQSCTSCLRPCARIMLKIISPTTLQFFESSASLETELLLSPEMMDAQGTCCSINMTAPLIWCLFPWLNQNKQLLTIWTILSDEKNQSWLGSSPDVINRVKWQKKKSSRDCYVLLSQPAEHMVNKNESRMCDVTHYLTSSFQEKIYVRN